MGREEFFLYKAIAIGWPLLEYGKDNPQYTIDFVANEPALSNLSRREAQRRIEIN
jgi:3-methyladenine DNA glycosylase AlkD